MKKILLISFLLISLSQKNVAQEKSQLGHANIDLIISLMPEAIEAEAKLKAFQAQLTMQIYIGSGPMLKDGKLEKLEELREQPEFSLSKENVILKRDLEKYEKERNELIVEVEEKYNIRKQVLFKSVFEKLEKAISSVATTEGYSYVFNSADGGHAALSEYDPNHDLTTKILQYLGIKHIIPDKIGYANLDSIYLGVPEIWTEVNQILDKTRRYGNALLRQYDSINPSKEEVLRLQLEEFQERKDNGELVNPAKLEEFEREAKKYKEEREALTKTLEMKVQVYQKGLMKPIQTKINTAITTIAKKEGYTYIFNKIDGSGVDIIIFVPEEHDITLKVIHYLKQNP